VFNGGWFRVDVVKVVGDEAFVLREGIDGVYAKNHLDAFSKAFDRNPVKPEECLATQAVTGWRNRNESCTRLWRRSDDMRLKAAVSKYFNLIHHRGPLSGSLSLW
jgi:hypothetical protein